MPIAADTICRHFADERCRAFIQLALAAYVMLHDIFADASLQADAAAAATAGRPSQQQRCNVRSPTTMIVTPPCLSYTSPAYAMIACLRRLLRRRRH